MLGRHHLSITFGTVFPFIIPIIFTYNEYLIYAFSFLSSALIGSIMPDADCGGKPKLYYDFKPIYDVMIPLQEFVVWLFKKLNQKYSLNMEYEVGNEHRGIMHAPIGVFISSSVFAIIAFVLSLIFAREFVLIASIIVFVGLLLGQFLHLLEDSCTVAGINWNFPFSTKEFKGNIYTFQKYKNKKDIRPDIYQKSLISITAVLFFGYSLQIFNFLISMIYVFIFFSVFFIWILIIVSSKTEFKFWYKNVKNSKRNK